MCTGNYIKYIDELYRDKKPRQKSEIQTKIYASFYGNRDVEKNYDKRNLTTAFRDKSKCTKPLTKHGTCNYKMENSESLLDYTEVKPSGDSSSKGALSPTKKSLSLTQIILLNAVVCGVEVCACAGFTYIPPMLLKAGYTEENMSIILGMGPLLGFIFVPIIGRASDRCKSPYGRRRPFILGLSIFLIISLLLIPYGDFFSNLMFGFTPVSKSVALVVLTLSVVLLDFTSQACLTPCEALLSDASRGTSQRDRVFMVYSQMVSLGGFIGYLITAVDWSNNFIGIYFGTQERSIFTLLVILYWFLLGATVLVAQEEPLKSLPQCETDSEEAALSPIKPENKTTILPLGNGTLESGYESSGSEDGGYSPVSFSPGRSGKIGRPRRQRGISFLWNPFGVIFSLVLSFFTRLRFVAYFMNLIKLICCSLYEKLPENFRKVFDVPLVLRRLALANFCSWTALMGFNLFFTDFVGQAVYQGNPNAPENSFLRNRYDEGVRMGSWGLLLHCITSASYAFFVESLVEKHGTRKTYLMGMVVFSISMFIMVIFKNVVVVCIMASLTGFAYATLTTIPFILVTKYHSSKEVYFFDVYSKPSRLLPVIQSQTSSSSNQRGIATDMGTLDSAYFLSQVVLSALMGYIVHMTGTVMSYMFTAGVMGLLSCGLITQLITNKHDIHRIKQQKHRERGRTINL